jgi:hypothetical protein
MHGLSNQDWAVNIGDWVTDAVTNSEKVITCHWRNRKIRFA